MSGKTEDLRTFVCRGANVLVPKEGTSYPQLTGIGIQIISDTDDDWYLARLPNLWSVRQNRKDHVHIIDSANRIRIEMHIKIENDQVIHLMTNVLTRFYVESKVIDETRTAFLKDRLDDNFEMPICTCEYLVDAPSFECEKNAFNQLRREFPGCVDPSNWDSSNPLVSIKDAYIKG